MFDIVPVDEIYFCFLQVLAFVVKMNINANQAAQGANYAGRAMNAFQSAVEIDNQQPQAEGTTFWFRWLIRIVSVITGIRTFFPGSLFIFNRVRSLLVAMVCGVIAALSIHATCIAAGVIMVYVNRLIGVFVDV